MGEGSFFTRADCMNALDRNDGDLDEALLELEKKALEPFRKRFLELQDVEDSGSQRRADDYAVVKNKTVSIDVNVF